MASKNVRTIAEVDIDIDIEFDIDEFDTSEIINEIEIRNNRGGFTTKEISNLANILGFKIGNNDCIKISSLSDKMKFEYICKIFNKYSLQQIESALPE